MKALLLVACLLAPIAAGCLGDSDPPLAVQGHEEEIHIHQNDRTVTIPSTQALWDHELVEIQVALQGTRHGRATHVFDLTPHVPAGIPATIALSWEYSFFDCAWGGAGWIPLDGFAQPSFRRSEPEVVRLLMVDGPLLLQCAWRGPPLGSQELAVEIGFDPSVVPVAVPILLPDTDSLAIVATDGFLDGWLIDTNTGEVLPVVGRNVTVHQGTANGTVLLLTNQSAPASVYGDGILSLAPLAWLEGEKVAIESGSGPIHARSSVSTRGMILGAGLCLRVSDPEPTIVGGAMDLAIVDDVAKKHLWRGDVNWYSGLPYLTHPYTATIGVLIEPRPATGDLSAHAEAPRMVSSEVIDLRAHALVLLQTR